MGKDTFSLHTLSARIVVRLEDTFNVAPDNNQRNKGIETCSLLSTK